MILEASQGNTPQFMIPDRCTETDCQNTLVTKGRFKSKHTSVLGLVFIARLPFEKLRVSNSNFTSSTQNSNTGGRVWPVEAVLGLYTRTCRACLAQLMVDTFHGKYISRALWSTPHAKSMNATPLIIVATDKLKFSNDRRDAYK